MPKIRLNPEHIQYVVVTPSERSEGRAFALSMESFMGETYILPGDYTLSDAITEAHALVRRMGRSTPPYADLQSGAIRFEVREEEPVSPWAADAAERDNDSYLD